jgi:hypothetical protein
MLQPVTGYIRCSVCNASYESETKLREHEAMSHRRGGSTQVQETEAVAPEPENLINLK